MDQTRLDYFREKLEARKNELLAMVEDTAEDRAAVELDQQSVGRLSRMDAIQQQNMALAKAGRRQSELIRIEQAFGRMADEEFGFCTECGEEIAENRLELDPSISICINCARAAER